MKKVIIAFILGFVSFLLMFILGESFGIYIAFTGVAFYHFVSQYLLSLGNPKALFQDWLIILSFNAILIVTGILVLCIEPKAKNQALIAVVSIVCSILGAGLAGRLANKDKQK